MHFQALALASVMQGKRVEDEWAKRLARHAAYYCSEQHQMTSQSNLILQTPGLSSAKIDSYKISNTVDELLFVEFFLNMYISIKLQVLTLGLFLFSKMLYNYDAFSQGRFSFIKTTMTMILKAILLLEVMMLATPHSQATPSAHAAADYRSSAPSPTLPCT